MGDPSEIAQQIIAGRTLRTIRGGPRTGMKGFLVYELDGPVWRWRFAADLKADIRARLIATGQKPTEPAVTEVLKIIHLLTHVEWPQANDLKRLQKLLGRLDTVPVERMERYSRAP